VVIYKLKSAIFLLKAESIILRAHDDVKGEPGTFVSRILGISAVLHRLGKLERFLKGFRMACDP